MQTAALGGSSNVAARLLCANTATITTYKLTRFANRPAVTNYDQRDGEPPLARGPRVQLGWQVWTQIEARTHQTPQHDGVAAWVQPVANGMNWRCDVDGGQSGGSPLKQSCGRPNRPTRGQNNPCARVAGLAPSPTVPFRTGSICLSCTPPTSQRAGRQRPCHCRTQAWLGGWTCTPTRTFCGFYLQLHEDKHRPHLF